MSETIVKNPGKNYLAAARRRRLRAALQTFCALLLTLIVGQQQLVGRFQTCALPICSTGC